MKPVAGTAPRAGRPRKAARAARQDALLRTALDLFVAHGYASVSLLMLARAARVAVRTIYVKFGNKQGVLEALIAAEYQRHGAELDALSLGTLGVRAKLERLTQHVARRCVRPELVRLQAMVTAHADPAPARYFRAAGSGQVRTQLLGVLSEADHETMLRTDFIPVQLCALFFSCIGNHHGRSSGLDALPGPDVDEGFPLFQRVAV